MWRRKKPVRRQRQLAGLVRAPVRKSKILILDGATVAMDYRMERSVMDRVRSYFHGTGAGLLLIAHQHTLAYTLDRILILEQGKIDVNGTPEQLLTKKNSFSRAYQYILHPKTNQLWQE